MSDNKPIISVMGQNLENPEDEEQYFKWYHEGHIKGFFQSDLLKKVYRYKRVGDDEALPQYLTIYHFDSLDDREKWKQSSAFEAGIEAGGIERPGGINVTSWVGNFELIREWEK